MLTSNKDKWSKGTYTVHLCTKCVYHKGEGGGEGCSKVSTLFKRKKIQVGLHLNSGRNILPTNLTS